MKGQDVFSNPSDRSEQLEGVSLAEHYRWKNIELARQGKFGYLKSNLGYLKTSFTYLAGHLDDCYSTIYISGAKGTGKKEIISEFTRIEKVYRKLNNAPDVVLKTYNAEIPKELFSKNEELTTNLYIQNIEYFRPDEQEMLLAFLIKRKSSIPYTAYTNRLFLSSETTLKFMVHQKLFSRELYEMICEKPVYLPALNERLPDLLELFYSTLVSITNIKQYPPAWLLNKIYLFTWPENIDTLVKLVSILVDRHGSDVNLWLESQVLPEIQKFIRNQNDEQENTKEKLKIEATLNLFSGDKDKTSRFLKLSKNQLLEKMMFYKIR